MTDRASTVGNAGGVELRDGLTTAMTYAVVSTAADLGPASGGHGRDANFWGMRKPPFEAYKIVEVLLGWGARVFVVDPVDSPAARPVVCGLPCHATLTMLPERVDCAVVSAHPRHVQAIVEDLVAANVETAWLQYSLMKAGAGAAFTRRGIRVVEGCVLMHWDVDHVTGFDKGRHICHIHAILSRAWRVRHLPDGSLVRLAPDDVRSLPFDRESFGAKLIAPLYPDVEVLK